MHSQSSQIQPAVAYMSDDSNVIQFRKRPLAETELDAYRKMTRDWHPEMRRLMCPEHFRHDESFCDDE